MLHLAKRRHRPAPYFCICIARSVWEILFSKICIGGLLSYLPVLWVLFDVHQQSHHHLASACFHTWFSFRTVAGQQKSHPAVQSHTCPAARVPGVGACRALVDEATAGKRPAGPCPEAGPVSLLSSAGAALHWCVFHFVASMELERPCLWKALLPHPSLSWFLQSIRERLY